LVHELVPDNLLQKSRNFLKVAFEQPRGEVRLNDLPLNELIGEDKEQQAWVGVVLTLNVPFKTFVQTFSTATILPQLESKHLMQTSGLLELVPIGERFPLVFETELALIELAGGGGDEVPPEPDPIFGLTP